MVRKAPKARKAPRATRVIRVIRVPPVRKAPKVPPVPPVLPARKGPEGQQGEGIDADQIIDSGVLSDIHHIKLTQDGNDKKIAVFDAPDYELREGTENAMDLIMAVGDMTMIAAKAASQSGMALPITFDWASDSDAVTVDGGAIDAVASTSKATVTVTAVGRGVEIDLTIKVLDLIRRIELASGQATSYVLPIGGSIELMTPVAYNEEEDGDVIDGAEALIGWVSSDPDIVSVDGNTITAEGRGKAEITAQGQGVTSKAKIAVTVAGGYRCHQVRDESISVQYCRPYQDSDTRRGGRSGNH